MAPATGLEGGKDPPGTPMSRIADSFQRFRVTHNLVSPQRMITPPQSVSERIATTSTNMNPPPLNDVITTSIIVDNERTDDIADAIHAPRQIEPNGPTSEELSLSNNKNNETKLSSAPNDTKELELAKKAKSSSSVKSRDPDGSIAGTIRRRVAVQDDKLNSIIHSLRPDPINEDNSLISGMTSAPLANISDDISLPTEWLGYLHPNYIKMLNKIPIKFREELIASVDRYAKSHLITTVNTVISYANELIDEYYSSDNIQQASSSSSSSNDNIIQIPDVTFTDNIEPHTIKKATDIPKSIVEDQSVIESVSRVFMKELNENRKSQLEDQQRQTEVHREIINTMHEMSKNPSSIDKKGSNWLDKMVLQEKASTFPKIPTTINETTLGQWYDEITARMLTAPWDIDGTSILDMPHVGNIAETKESYRIRSTMLSKILTELLHTKDSNIVVSLRATSSTNNGAVLLDAIRDFLLPLENMQILDVLTDLGTCVQNNGETVEGFSSRLENIFNRINKMGYTTMEQMKLAYHQRGFLKGAYSSHKSLSYLQDKLKNDDTNLKSLGTSDEFSKAMTKNFTNNDVYKDGKMLQLTNIQLGHGRAHRGPDTSSLSASNFGLNANAPTADDIDAIMAQTKCPICRLAPSHPEAHFLGKCEQMKRYGYKFTYNPADDHSRTDFEKKSTQRNKTAALDAADAKLDAELKVINDKKSKEGQVKAETERVRLAAEAAGTIVGKGNKTATSDAEKDAAIKSNLDAQAKIAGSGKRVTGGLSRFASTAFVEASVDAETTVNEVNSEASSCYFRTVVNSILLPLDRPNLDGSIRKCISVATHIVGSAKTACVGTARSSTAATDSSSNEIVPDSGATSHMLRHREDFEDDYVKCTDVFVLMGDGSEIPVLGFGTARIKIDGFVTRLVNTLHVPGLDCDLFSCTRHGRNGKGCSFVLADSQMHLSFPNFIITRDIPINGDLRLTLEPLTDDDWGIPNFICDGTELQDEHLNVFQTRLDMLNQVFKGRVMTRAQRKQNLDTLKQALGDNHKRDNTDNDIIDNDNFVDSSFNPKSLGLPDNYLYEGSPDKQMMDVLKELNIDDLRDFLKDNDQHNNDTSTQFEKQLRAPPPQYHLESSRGDVKDRLTAFQLQSYFGGRQLKDFNLLSKLGTGISVIDNNQEIPTVGELVNRKRGKRKRKGSKAEVPLQVVGMDIGYGDGVAVGGSKYVLVLIDQCTTNSFVYGMHGASGADVCEALWKFFIEAGGFPETIQCDFDPRLIGGKAAALLRSHGTRIRAAPPNRQDKNGLVERRWASLTKMARSFLTEAKLPKKFWYWAIREANIRINLLPITQQQNGIDNPALMSTPYYEFFGIKPDYRILFPFGCIGSFRRARDGNHKRTNFESQCLLGIALGRSEFTNGMIFYNPNLDSFSTSADYLIDKNRHIGEVFPSLLYDGGLTTSVLSDKPDGPTKFEIGDKVFVQDSTTYDIMEATVTMPPTTKSKYYTVLLTDDSTSHDVDPCDIYNENNVPSSGKPSTSLGFFRPDWMKPDQKVSILHDEVYKQGYLNLDKDNVFEFVSRDTEGKITFSYPLADLQYSWKMRMQENTFDIGWQENIANRIYGSGRHVSATNLSANVAPANLKTALAGNNPDRNTWNSSYNEEYDGLDNLDVFTEITYLQYKEYRRIHGEKATAIPTMNLFSIKPDMDGNPIRAKSRIVALGNLERRIWSREDKYAPVLSSTASRLLVSMAVEDGRKLKQADCKNAFCNGILPDDEICIVKPPIGCPRSKPGTFWKLNKTLYGLTRSAHHWYTKISNHLKDDMGFSSMDQDQCVYKCSPIEGQPPIYVGLYVDDLVYYSKSDKVEEWFVNNLKSHLKVDFMGDASWFLGQRYDWYTDPDDGNVSCHISQQAMIEGMLERHQLEHCTTARSPYRSGICIDRIDHDEKDISTKTKLIKEYQSLIGGLNWLSINTRPDINTAYSLLSQFNCNPSQGHMDSAKYVLRYLKHTSSHGIWFKQGENRLHGSVAIPEELKGNELIVFTDSNWGPQDASKPKPNETRTVTLEELKSIQGYYITRMGGPLYWGVHREKRGSRSSCFAEIKSIDDGIRAIQYLRHLMKQLGLPDVDFPTPLLNDNQGSIDWIESGCKPTKKLRHENLADLGIAEAREHKEVQIYWMPGASNLADIFTKEDKDVAHYESIRDKMVMPRESFAIPNKSRSNNNSTSWGVLERRTSDRNYENMTSLTKSKSKSPLTNHYYNDESEIIERISSPQPVAVVSE